MAVKKIFECFARNSRDALATVDADGGICYANPRFRQLWEVPEGGPGPRTIWDLQQPQLPEYRVRAALAGRNETQFTCDSDKGTHQGRLTCRFVPLPDRDTAMYVMEVRLDGVHQKAESHRRSQKSFYRVLDEFPAFVYLQRRDYRVAYANKKVRNLYGETESRLCYEVFAGRTSPCPVCPTFEVFETGESMEWEFTDDKGRSFCIYDYPFENEEGEQLVMELGIDVTDLKRVEKELFQAQKLRAIGVLAGGLAHDLNNNLVPIIFNTDYALSEVRDPQIREPLSEALEAAHRAAKLVEQVLEYSRQQDISRTPLHLRPLIIQSLKGFKQSVRKPITFHIDVDERPDCICANTGQMQQVLDNLLHNAEQAMPDGGAITIRLGTKTLESLDAAIHPGIVPGDFISLTIHDTGSGIKAEDVDCIFEPFFTTKKKQGGTGMGLAVVHAIISNSGGVIKVDSRPGAGTAFIIYLPKAQPPARRRSSAVQTIPAGGNRVLLVDDDPGALSAMARTLRNNGFEVDTAAGGDEGLARFMKAPDQYGLVLTDQSMPGMNGIELSEKILTRNKDAKIVICTGHVEPALEEESKRKGIAGFAIKPMTPRRLVEEVKTYCTL